MTFQAKLTKDQYKAVNPNLRLHFHPVAEREDVLKTIKAEQMYSWDIPILFAETRDYLVVTSPGWQNHWTERVGSTTWGPGDYSEAANKAIAPLLQALRSYFDGKK